MQKLCELADEIRKLENEEVKNDSPERHLTGAWRACWGVRGLQWFGIRNALTPWRELRRVSEKRFIHQGIERALWNRARAGDVEGFLEMLGGLAASPQAQQASCRSKMSPRTNLYGQTVKKIIGIIVRDELTQAKQEIITRPFDWTLITEFPDLTTPAAPVAATVVAAPVAAQSIDIQSILPGFDAQTISIITVIPKHPSKTLKPKTNLKPKPKSLKPLAVGIKPTQKPPDQAHQGAQNAASP